MKKIIYYSPYIPLGGLIIVLTILILNYIIRNPIKLCINDNIVHFYFSLIIQMSLIILNLSLLTI